MKLLPLKITAFLLVVGALSGCYSQSGTISREPVSFLSVTPVKTQLTAVIDGAAPITLEPQRKAALLRINPGVHRIQIFDNGTLRVDREVLVSDQQTLEIYIP